MSEKLLHLRAVLEARQPFVSLLTKALTHDVMGCLVWGCRELCQSLAKDMVLQALSLELQVAAS